MKKPNKITPDDLQHPKGLVKAFNGDMRKPRSKKRWNGAPDYEDGGFTSRSVHTVSPNQPPSNPGKTPVVKAPPLTRGMVPMAYSPYSQPKKKDEVVEHPAPLTDRQKKLLRKR